MRGILFDEIGKDIVSHRRCYTPRYLENGYVEEPSKDWEDALIEILSYVSEKAGEQGIDIDAIVTTAQRSSVLPVDRDLVPLSDAIMWEDTRTGDICDALKGHDEEIFMRSGAEANPVFAASKMTWIRANRPDIYEKTYKFMTVSDYLIAFMTGSACTDQTYGSRTNLMNIRTMEWDDRLLELFNVERDKLCDIVEPGSICGTLKEEIAGKTGCRAGIPVITAGGDQQCGAIGQGVIREGILSLTAGTGGFLVTATDHIPENMNPNVICSVSSVKGQYMLESSVLTCASAFDWFRGNFYEDADYDFLQEEILKSPPGANGCVLVPYFQGRLAPDWNSEAKAIFANVTLSTRKCDMLRALIEGICCELANGIESLGEYIDINDVFLNGGLTNMDEFNQILCDASGKHLYRAKRSEATSRGAFCVAAVTMGLYPGVKEAFDKVEEKTEFKEYLPDEEDYETYKRIREEMNRLYSRVYKEVNDEQGQ